MFVVNLIAKFIDWVKSPLGSDFGFQVGFIQETLMPGNYVLQIANGKSLLLSLDRRTDQFQVGREARFVNTN